MLDFTNYKECKENLIFKLLKKLNTQDYNNYSQIINIMEYISGKKITQKDLHTIHRTTINKNNKTYRIRKRIIKIFKENEQPIFITLTFNEKYINVKCKRKYVAEFLNENCKDYVANVDYGKEKGREHYHCVGSNRIDPTKWKYGSCNVKKITNKNEGAIAEYVNKFSLHATKTTTNQERIITKRRKKK